jgi:flagellar hook-associated protein 3 FlgL
MRGIDTLRRLDSDAGLLRLRLDTLNRQLATGRRAEAPGDLAPQLPHIAALRADAGRHAAYRAAVSEASGRTDVAQTALGRLAGIAREFAESVTAKLDPGNPDTISFAAARARSALIETGQILNTRAGNDYLFGGSDSQSPPVPSPDDLPSGGFAAAIAASVATLGGGNAAAVAAATRATAASDAAGTTPFSAFLSASPGLGEPRRSVPSDDGAMVAYGIPANRNAVAVSHGETTGSWARDLLRGLASVAAMTPAQAAASPADFTQFIGMVRGGFRSADSALADEAGALGVTQKHLDETQQRHADADTALQGQLSEIQDVDLAEVLTRLKSTETTLQASYSAIGRISQLTLAQFLR